LYKQTDSDYRRKELEKFMLISPCPSCEGKRLKDKVLSVRVGKRSIIEVTELSIKKSIEFFENLKLSEFLI